MVLASENNVVMNFLVGEPKVRKKGAARVGEMGDYLDFSLFLQL